MCVILKVFSCFLQQVKDSFASDGEIKPLDLIMLLIFSESFKSSLQPLKTLLFNQRLTEKLLVHVLEHNMPVSFSISLISG